MHQAYFPSPIRQPNIFMTNGGIGYTPPTVPNFPANFNQHLVSQQHFQQEKNIKAVISQSEMIVKEKMWTELFAKTLMTLEDCAPGYELKMLLSKLQMPRPLLQDIQNKIHSDMMILMTALGVQRVMIFGSTVTGLDFGGSDIDFHISLHRSPKTEIEIGDVIRSAALLANHPQSQAFCVLETIYNARVPIIRLVHVPTNTTCDVNFSSMFGYLNSCFIMRILNYDPRIRNLAVILKLWSKSYKIAKCFIMSNYCLVMLMIFYLQNLKVPMLDTIKNNQRSKTPLILDQKDGWNFYYDANINRAYQNTQTLHELLVGFFKFYHDLQFTQKIVSIYNGQLIPREQFTCHPDFETYRNVVSQSELPKLNVQKAQNFIVQDGFEHNLNIGIKYSENRTNKFFRIIRSSDKLCRVTCKDDKFSTLLKKLLTDLPFKKDSKYS